MRRFAAMHEPGEEPIAAPPDHAGHQGTRTTPGEAMQTPQDDLERRRAASPAEATGRRVESARGAGGRILFLLLVVGAAFLAMYVYGRPF